MIEIRLLSEFPKSELAPLLAESEAQGFRLLRRLVDDYESGSNCFDRAGECLIGAFHEGALVGIGGLNIDPFLNDPKVGRIRRVYVLSAFRGQGAGRALMAALLAHARGKFRMLRLRTREAPARRLYESLGFQYLGEGETSHELELS